MDLVKVQSLALDALEHRLKIAECERDLFFAQKQSLAGQWEQMRDRRIEAEQRIEKLEAENASLRDILREVHAAAVHTEQEDDKAVRTGALSAAVTEGRAQLRRAVTVPLYRIEELAACKGQ